MVTVTAISFLTSCNTASQQGLDVLLDKNGKPVKYDENPQTCFLKNESPKLKSGCNKPKTNQNTQNTVNKTAHTKEEETKEEETKEGTKNICSLLETNKILRIQPMEEYFKSNGRDINFTSEVFFLEIEAGLGKKINAVFKPVDEDNISEAFGEVAAYKASKFLGFPNVPPTTFRTIENRFGSVQLFINTNVDLSKPDLYKQVLKEASQDDLAKLKLFYFVFGQHDTGPRNLLANKENGILTLYAIDNSRIVSKQYIQKYGKLPFVRVGYVENHNTNDDDWDKSFDCINVEEIRNKSESELDSLFNKALPKGFYKGGNLRYKIYRDFLYVEWGAFDENEEQHIKAYTTYYPKDAMEALEKLTKSVLVKNIFSHAKNAEFLTDEYLEDILKRRDEVLESCHLQHLSYKLP